MASRRTCLLIGLISIFLAASSAHSFDWEEEGDLFWPAPPAEPRVMFIKNIVEWDDLNIKTSLFKRFKNLLIGKKEFSLIKPMDVAVGEDDTLYITDAEAGVIYIYSAEERTFKGISEIDRKINLISPIGISVSANGTIFVVDSALSKVFALDAKGRSKFILGEKDGIGRPSDVFVKDDKIYITDAQNCLVHIFDLNGEHLKSFGRRGKGEGEFNAPSYIYVDHNERVYVSDTLNFRIQIFSAQGEYLKKIGIIGDSSGTFARPKGVAVDTFGHIYVVDALFDNVQIFNYDGQFLLNFGKVGGQEGEFWMPTGIFIDEDNYIYIADSYNKRIGIFQYRFKDKSSGLTSVQYNKIAHE